MSFNIQDPILQDSATVFLPGLEDSPAMIPSDDIPAWGDEDHPANFLKPLTDGAVAPTPARTLEEFCELLKLRRELSEESEAELDLFCSPTLSQDERLVLIFAYVLETRELFRTLCETGLPEACCYKDDHEVMQS